MKIFKIYLIVISLFFCFSLKAEEKKLNNNTEFNVYTGMFDFSDDGKRSTLIGFQHQEATTQIFPSETLPKQSNK